MSTARKPGKLRPHAKSFQECLRQFLTPAVWRQAHQARAARQRSTRWTTQALVLVLLTTTWCCGDSAAERFETAKAVCVALLPKRKRPGKTVQGFQKALAKLPVPVLRAVGDGIRRALPRLLDDQWLVNGFVPLGCDGSRLECPRTAELEGRLGKAGKDLSAPTLWITALVHVRLGVPWAWRWGKGNASERAHLIHLVRQLPKAALVIADAGYVGFDLARILAAAQVDFLIRLSSVVTLYTEDNLGPPARFRESAVYYWPPRQRGLPPLPVRLIRVRGKKKRGDVWLMTNVMDPKRLSHAWAGQFYRWRWENEGLFRTYKRTLSKLKLLSRSVRLVHREAEGSMLATQLLLAQGAWGLRPVAQGAPGACSARKVLLAVRREIAILSAPQRRVCFGRCLSVAHRERRERTSGKVRRPWPRPRPTTPPKPPRILKLTAKEKHVIHRLKKHVA